jgi:hypothetical protein
LLKLARLENLVRERIHHVAFACHSIAIAAYDGMPTSPTAI